MTLFWRVIVWDEEGYQRESDVVSFGTALFSSQDWKGEWIGGGRQLRSLFTLPSSAHILRARAYGIYYHLLFFFFHRVL